MIFLNLWLKKKFVLENYRPYLDVIWCVPDEIYEQYKTNREQILNNLKNLWIKFVEFMNKNKFVHIDRIIPFIYYYYKVSHLKDDLFLNKIIDKKTTIEYVVGNDEYNDINVLIKYKNEELFNFKILNGFRQHVYHSDFYNTSNCTFHFLPLKQYHSKYAKSRPEPNNYINGALGVTYNEWKQNVIEYLKRKNMSILDYYEYWYDNANFQSINNKKSDNLNWRDRPVLLGYQKMDKLIGINIEEFYNLQVKSDTYNNIVFNVTDKYYQDSKQNTADTSPFELWLIKYISTGHILNLYIFIKLILNKDIDIFKYCSPDFLPPTTKYAKHTNDENKAYDYFINNLEKWQQEKTLDEKTPDNYILYRNTFDKLAFDNSGKLISINLSNNNTEFTIPGFSMGSLLINNLLGMPIDDKSYEMTMWKITIPKKMYKNCFYIDPKYLENYKINNNARIKIMHDMAKARNLILINKHPKFKIVNKYYEYFYIDAYDYIVAKNINSHNNIDRYF